MKKGRSLSDQLNELDNVAPDGPESDEEDYDATREADHDASEDDGEDEARSHARQNYYMPSTSDMRRAADYMEGADANQRRKYEGVKTTRRELLGEDDGDLPADLDPSEDEDEEEEFAIDGTQDSSKESDSDDDGENSETSLPSKKKDQEGKELPNRSHIQTNGRAKNVHFEQPMDVISSTKNLNAAQSDAQLLRDLRSRTREDAAKGRDARKQRATYSKILGVRIRAQKVVRAGGRIPSQLLKRDESHLNPLNVQCLDTTLEGLDDISRHLFTVQQQILDSFTKAGSRESTVVSAALPALQPLLDEVIVSRKRSIDDVSYHDKQVEALLRLDQQLFEPLWREVLSRWSSRTSATLDEGLNRNKFQISLKAMNQSAEDQIDRGMNGDAFERLRKRTRVWRGNESEDRLAVGSTLEPATQDDDFLEDEERNTENVDIFDDSDFYSSLLRELIDSRGASSEIGGGLEVPDSSLLWAQAAKKAAKKNKNGEMKASKGRKLRYDVIEKVEHFMPPVPRETWSKEQIDRLFRQIKGADLANPEANGDDDQQLAVFDVGDKEDGKLGGLRLFA